MSDLLCYIPLNLNIKNKLHLHQTKVNNDTLCFISLKKLKNEILLDIDELNDHIIHCNLC